tara:strand:- start:259 stop:1122 length:864 start_codon:yes stop_codon:yes gene_type:complete
MYIQHFGLAQYPFSLTPNTQYFLKLPSHERAFDFIVQALQDESCFTKIVGEVGTGKTMLCRKVLNALEAHGDSYVTAFIPNTVLDEESIMYAIAEELQLNFDPAASYYELLKIISQKLIQLSTFGKTVVLFIDEEQAMTEESLEAIRLLTTIEKSAGKTIPLQVILFGQPELDLLLQRPALRELSRDISASYQLAALDRDGVEAYLDHRLLKAGYNSSNLFSQKAVDLIFHASKGVPRLINIIAHKALMVAFGKGEHSLTDQHIELAIADTESTQQTKLKARRFFSN